MTVSSDNSWLDFWNEQKNAGHRSQEEVFLMKLGRERLLHLTGGTSLLDFGCGSADLFQYYASEYESAVGVDFAQNMLDKAQTKLDALGLDTQLILADNTNVGTKVSGPFDRITSSGVMQYLNYEEIEHLLTQFEKLLAKDGCIALFDFIDPHSHLLFKAGLSSAQPRRSVGALLNGGKELFRRWKRRAKGESELTIGHAHSPDRIVGIAARQGFNAEYLRSIYYEYRYHLLLKRA